MDNSSEIDKEILKIINCGFYTKEETEKRTVKTDDGRIIIPSVQPDYSDVEKVLNYFLKNPQFINNKINDEGDTILHQAVYSKYGYSIIKLLTTFEQFKEIDLNAQNKRGETPLFLAVSCQLIRKTKLLLEAKANPEIKNSNGTSAKSIIMKLANQDDSYKKFVNFLNNPKTNQQRFKCKCMSSPDSFDNQKETPQLTAISPESVNIEIINIETIKKYQEFELDAILKPHRSNSK